MDNCAKKKHLKRIARGYETAEVYNKAFLFYDKAFNISECEKNNITVLVQKQKLYHQLKDYTNSYKTLKKLKGHTSYANYRINATYLAEYNTTYLKDYKNSIKELYIQLEKEKGVEKTANTYYIEKENFRSTLSSVNKKIIKQLAYNYYKIGELDKSLTLLHILTEESFGASFFVNYRYWCMYFDLYEQYKNIDYRVHLLFAYRYISESDDLRSAAYYREEIPQPRCDPHGGLNIPYVSNDEQERFIINLGIKEIALAEKITHKNFDLYRAEALMEMKKMNEAKKILDLLIIKNPNDLKTLDKLHHYYFLKELYLDIFNKSKRNLKRKEKYEQLQKQILEKATNIDKSNKKEPIIIEGY